MAKEGSISLEWFGATTFRLRACGLTVFLDTWLERPDLQKCFLPLSSVQEADYIFISHAHFDHLPGADRLAKQTGAIVVANCEAINLLRSAGVPETQLMAVQGGERIPLFNKVIRQQAAECLIPLRPAPPGAPRIPHPDYAVMSVDVWPSLHCLLPNHDDIPEFMDTGTTYTGSAHRYICTFDVNYGMKHGLLKLDDIVPDDKRTPGMSSLISYFKDRTMNLFSDHDGGQLMFNIHVSEGKTVLWNAHLGGYEGILRALDPKPTVAILGIAGRANYNGLPFDGSAAHFATQQVQWLGQPREVIWCLHDESCIPPYYVDTAAATKMVEKETTTRIVTMEHGRSIMLQVE